jgi:YggT family protein
MLKWSRKVLPPVSRIDFSPLIPIIGIQLLKMLILPPIDHIARLLT